MKTSLFLLLGLLGIAILALGNKKKIFIVKIIGILLILAFVIMLISIFL